MRTAQHVATTNCMYTRVVQVEGLLMNDALIRQHQASATRCDSVAPSRLLARRKEGSHRTRILCRQLDDRLLH